MLNKPIVDGLEQDLNGKATVLRLDITSRLGRQAAASYGVRGTPTLIVVDGQGQPVLTQVALVRPGPVKNQVEALIAATN